MRHFAHAHPTIKCPHCLRDQTGILRTAEHAIKGVLNPGQLYIICALKDCRHVIKDAQLDDAIQSTISAPGDLRDIPNYNHDKAKTYS